MRRPSEGSDSTSSFDSGRMRERNGSGNATLRSVSAALRNPRGLAGTASRSSPPLPTIEGCLASRAVAARSPKASKVRSCWLSQLNSYLCSNQIVAAMAWRCRTGTTRFSYHGRPDTLVDFHADSYSLWPALNLSIWGLAAS